MKNLTVESALKVNYMKELVMLTELERQLQRGNIDYWVGEDLEKYRFVWIAKFGKIC